METSVRKKVMIMKRGLSKRTGVFYLLLTLIISLSFITGCGGNGSDGDEEANGTGATINPRLAQTNDFLYQLQDIDLTALGNSN